MGVGYRKEKPIEKLLNPNAGLRSTLRLIGVGLGGRGEDDVKGDSQVSGLSN